LGRRYILSGVWPNLEEEAGLRSGKERMKSCIKQFGQKVTSAILGLTDTLIIGEKPGDNKVTQAHEKEVKVIDIHTLNHLIMGELSLDKVQTKYTSGQGASVQKRGPPSTVPISDTHAHRAGRNRHCRACWCP
jgi:BRCT domain type II-containing protein